MPLDPSRSSDSSLHAPGSSRNLDPLASFCIQSDELFVTRQSFQAVDAGKVRDAILIDESIARQCGLPRCSVADVSERQRGELSDFAISQLFRVKSFSELDRHVLDFAGGALATLEAVTFNQDSPMSLDSSRRSCLSEALSGALRLAYREIGVVLAGGDPEQLEFLEQLVRVTKLYSHASGGDLEVCEQLQELYSGVDLHCAQREPSVVDLDRHLSEEGEDGDLAEECERSSYDTSLFHLRDQLRSGIALSQVGRSALPFWRETLEQDFGSKAWGANLIELARVDLSELKQGYLSQLLNEATKQDGVAAAVLVNLLAVPGAMSYVADACAELAPVLRGQIIKHAYAVCNLNSSEVKEPDFGVSLVQRLQFRLFELYSSPV